MFGSQQKRKKCAFSDACLSARRLRFLVLCLIQLMFFTLPTSAQQPKSFSCGSNLPEFTLGIKTQLSSKQLNSLCTCISSNLDEKSKATGIELANMSKSTKVD